MLSRRQFFRGVSLGAGAVYLAPFLAQLQAAAPGAAGPRRIVFFLQGNGMYPDQIQPATIDRPREPATLEDRSLAEHELPFSIEPLTPWKDRLTLLHGLSSRVARGSHSSDFGALGCFPQSKGAYGETIDSAVARHLPSIFSHVGLGVMNQAEMGVIYNVSASAPGKTLPTQCQAEAAYQRLFASAAEGTARKSFDAKTGVLDFLADDVRRLQSRLNSAEKAKLDHYLEAFESMNARQSALLKAADRIKAHAPPAPEGQPTYAFERLEAQFDIAAGALIAGLTNVLTISSGCGHGFSGLSPDGTELGLGAGTINAHGIGHGSSMQGKTWSELHSLIRRQHVEKLARLITRLEATPEGQGSMLDNTLIVYTSDSAESHHPWSTEWPFLLIGDLGGRLRTGNRYLRYPWYGQPGHRTVANFYTTLLHMLGDRRERFGVEDIALKDLDQTGPLAELMV